jgi:hypothetical protein
MPWIFSIKTGILTKDNDVEVDKGYSGNLTDFNNPDDQNIKNEGPIPVGVYYIGLARFPVDNLGPLALPLTPWPTNQMYNRDDFFIHGDNQECNHTASDGCIILQRSTRQTIVDSGDQVLQVID